LTALMLVRRLVDEIVTGQRFRDVCAGAAKRFRRGNELFHDSFMRVLTPGG